MLMPAAVLVVIVLAAMAVDQSIIFMRQRSLVAAAQAAANDAAGYGIDPERFYEENVVDFSLERAAAAATATLAAHGFDVVPSVRLSDDGAEVEIRVEAEAESLFAKALPGGTPSTTVRATATALLLVPA